MKRFLGILLFVTAVSAETGWPAVIEAGDDYYEESPSVYRPSTSLSQQEADTLDSATAQARPWQEDGDSELDGSRPAVVIRGIQEQLMEDLLRMEQDLLLIRRLLGQEPSSSGPYHPSGFLSPFLWRPPVLPPGRRDPWTNNDEEADQPGDSPWFNFPALGFDRPVFPDFPQMPSVDDLPDNYDNSTYEVHEVNGSRVEVNTTVNKQSGDGFSTFFHKEVIHISPEKDADGSESSSTTTTTATPQVEEEGQGGEDEPVAEEEEEARPVPHLPEVANEVDNSGLPETSTREEVPAEDTVWVSRGAAAGRSLSAPSPSSASYIVNRMYDDDDDDNRVNGDDEDVPKPDLSGDTRVNHVTPDEQQGISMVDPEAEVFDLGLVNKEARRNGEQD